MGASNYILILIVSLLNVTTGFTQKGIALLVGIENIKTANYNTSYSNFAVSGVNIDLDRMASILKENGYEVVILKDVTADKILNTIKSASNNLNPGDNFLFYFTGHGDQQTDFSGDEGDAKDEVLVTYDRYLYDDEIYKVFLTHLKDQIILMIVDACHSGSSYKMLDLNSRINKNLDDQKSAIKQTDYFKSSLRNSNYCTIVPERIIDDQINLIYLGATSDRNVTGGDNRGGWMTRVLFDIYDGAITTYYNWDIYDYEKLACEINAYLKNQVFQLHIVGPDALEIVKQQPFKIK